MSDCYYKAEWSQTGAYFEIFAHEVLNYRYHWHNHDYEIDILMEGKAVFCSGKNSYVLGPKDMILINPGESHASLGLQPNTTSIVIHFNEAALQELLKANHRFVFKNAVSSLATQNDYPFAFLRFLAASMLKYSMKENEYTKFAAEGILKSILACCILNFSHDVVPISTDKNPALKKTLERITSFIEENHERKLSLEEAANEAQYNRTYFSDFFKMHFGVTFHEYLTRVRFEDAAWRLIQTDENLTNIAIGSGFPDLKSFNKQFKETFDTTPAAYRKQILDDPSSPRLRNTRRLLSIDEPSVNRTIRSWTEMNAFSPYEVL